MSEFFYAHLPEIGAGAFVMLVLIAAYVALRKPVTVDERQEAILRKSVRFEIYRDDKQEWRWRLRHPNGRILAVSEGYKRKPTLRRVLENTLVVIQRGGVIIAEDR